MLIARTSDKASSPSRDAAYSKRDSGASECLLRRQAVTEVLPPDDIGCEMTAQFRTMTSNVQDSDYPLKCLGFRAHMEVFRSKPQPKDGAGTSRNL
jgi:hypothetical protein